MPTASDALESNAQSLLSHSGAPAPTETTAFESAVSSFLAQSEASYPTTLGSELPTNAASTGLFQSYASRLLSGASSLFGAQSTDLENYPTHTAQPLSSNSLAIPSETLTSVPVLSTLNFGPGSVVLPSTLPSSSIESEITAQLSTSTPVYTLPSQPISTLSDIASAIYESLGTLSSTAVPTGAIG